MRTPIHSLNEFPLLDNLSLSHLAGSRHVRLLEHCLLFRHADDPEEPAEALKGLERQARCLLMAPEALESHNSYTYWLAAVAAVVCCCCCCCCWSCLLLLLRLSFFSIEALRGSSSRTSSHLFVGLEVLHLGPQDLPFLLRTIDGHLTRLQGT